MGPWKGSRTIKFDGNAANLANGRVVKAPRARAAIQSNSIYQLVHTIPHPLDRLIAVCGVLCLTDILVRRRAVTGGSNTFPILQDVPVGARSFRSGDRVQQHQAVIGKSSAQRRKKASQ
jgi:hypothetical protein